MKPKIDLERLRKDYNGSGYSVPDHARHTIMDLIELLEEANEIMNDCLKSDDNAFPEVPEGDIKEWQSRIKKENENA